jgi:signal transduction protein with GAF and PtsI domain
MNPRIRRWVWPLVAVGAVLQGGMWLLVRLEVLSQGAGLGLQLVVLWVLVVLFAIFAGRRVEMLSTRIEEGQQRHRLTLGQMEQMELQNAVLQAVTRTPDVTLAFQALARRVSRVVRCDRLGLALLTGNNNRFQTYTARVSEEERRSRPRPELEFSMDRSLVGQAVREREPIVVDDFSSAAPDYLDANVLHSGGFRSGLIMPLMSKGRAVGTINLVSRGARAFRIEDAHALEPIAEILAVAHVAQQAQLSVERYRAVEAMSEMTLSVANEINSALQIIIGHCDLLERSYHDPALQRDLATVIRQAQRISELLEKMRGAATARLREVAASVNQAGMGSSAEDFVTEENP